VRQIVISSQSQAVLSVCDRIYPSIHCPARRTIKPNSPLDGLTAFTQPSIVSRCPSVSQMPATLTPRQPLQLRRSRPSPAVLLSFTRAHLHTVAKSSSTRQCHLATDAVDCCGLFILCQSTTTKHAHRGRPRHTGSSTRTKPHPTLDHHVWAGALSALQLSHPPPCVHDDQCS